MGRLKALPSRLQPAPSRLRRAKAGETDRLHQRAKDRPNWYGTAAWQRLRARRLKHDKMVCQQTGCLLVGKYPAWNSPAVDHVIPHHWDWRRFFDFDNLQSVTKEWHDGTKQKMERQGLV